MCARLCFVSPLYIYMCVCVFVCTFVLYQPVCTFVLCQPPALFVPRCCTYSKEARCSSMCCWCGACLLSARTPYW